MGKPLTIDAAVAADAFQASQMTGLNMQVIEAQWFAENNQSILGTQYWTNDNPGNIKPGNPAVDAYASGKSANGFDIFPNSISGVNAYAALINTDPNYAGIRAAAKTGSSKKELAAIAASPWDQTHYGNGKSLTAAYNAITGAKISNVWTPADNASLQTGTVTDLFNGNAVPYITGTEAVAPGTPGSLPFGLTWNTLIAIGGGIGLVLILVNIAKGGKGVSFA